MLHKLVQKCYFCAIETKIEIIKLNVTNQWAGLCFYSCINFVNYAARPH